MNKNLAICVAIALLLGIGSTALFAGGQQDQEPEAVKKVVITIADQNTAESVIGIAFDRIAALIITDPRNTDLLDAKVFHNGVLGQEREMIEQVMAGTLTMTITSVGIFGQFDNTASILALPFLYKDTDHVRAVLDGPLFDKFNERFVNNIGVRVIHSGFPGFRYVYTKDKPIRSIEDFKGMKIRIPPSDVQRELFKALGANPTPMAFGEIYTGLQTGVIEGMENINEYIYEPRLYEQLNYATKTGHMFEPWLVIVSEKVWSTLSDMQKAIVKDAAVKAWNEQREAQSKRILDYEEKLKAKGMQFFEIDRGPLVEASKNVRASLLSSIPGGAELVAEIEALAK